MYDIDYYEDEAAPPYEGGGCLSIYTLPPLAAFLISFILMGLMIRFAYQQVSEVDFSEVAVVFNEEPEPLAPNESNPIAPLFTPEIDYWATKIVAWANDWNLDPNLVATIMQIESCGLSSATSSAGAMGLFQVMPYHFQTLDNPYNPDTNASRGLAYLAQAYETHQGNLRLTIASYNGGIGGAKRAEINWPAETQRYTYWGWGIYNDAIVGKKESATLNEWLGRGGSSLCQQAAASLGLR